MMKNFAKGIVYMLTHLHKAVKQAGLPSYYPEKARKSYFRRIVDNIVWCLRHREVNAFYALYGLDLRGGATR